MFFITFQENSKIVSHRHISTSYYSLPSTVVKFAPAALERIAAAPLAPPPPAHWVAPSAPRQQWQQHEHGLGLGCVGIKLGFRFRRAAAVLFLAAAATTTAAAAAAAVSAAAARGRGRFRGWFECGREIRVCRGERSVVGDGLWSRALKQSPFDMMAVQGRGGNVAFITLTARMHALFCALGFVLDVAAVASALAGCFPLSSVFLSLLPSCPLPFPLSKMQMPCIAVDFASRHWRNFTRCVCV